MPPRRLPPAARKLGANASPEERARAAIAKEEAVGGSKVRLTFRVVLARPDAEALSARAIREERNVEGVVEDILTAAVRGRSKS
jgi:hypothetical protein